MNSQDEKMKSELESFLNAGLQDERLGWPTVISMNRAKHCSYPTYGNGAKAQHRRSLSPSSSSQFLRK
jgi:hypothetical protein